MSIFYRRSRVQSYTANATVNQSDTTTSDIIRVINIYLWIHGIGFAGNFKRNFKNSVNLLLSFFLFFIFDSTTMYQILKLLTPLLFENRQSQRKLIFLLILLVMEWILRFLLLIKRKVLMLITQRVFDKYLKITTQKTLKFKLVLIFVFLSNDVFTILLNLYNSFF